MTIRDIYQNDLSKLNFDSNLSQNKLFADCRSCHTDLPKLRKGKVGGQVCKGVQEGHSKPMIRKK